VTVTREKALAEAGAVLGAYFASLSPEELAALEPAEQQERAA
jgi:hypothetical protein